MRHEYPLSAHGHMVADDRRMEAYRRAINAAVREGDVVVDLGSGTGVFAMLACLAGAAKVYAIEPGQTIALAESFARDNGLIDRIEFIPALSTRVTLPERADVIVSDLRGILPYFEAHLPSIIDARERLLKRGGILIPSRDRVYAAPVEAPEAFADSLAPWLRRPGGLDLSRATRHVTSSWEKRRFEPEQLLAPPALIADLDFTTVSDENLDVTVTVVVTRDGFCHGIAAWFDSELSAGNTISNAPGTPPLLYGSAFFRFAAPRQLRNGDQLELRLSATLLEVDYLWTWSMWRVESERSEMIEQHTSLESAPLSPKLLRRRASDHVGELDQEGGVELFILQQIRDGHSNGEIAQALTAFAPERYHSLQRALTRVAMVAERFTK